MTILSRLTPDAIGPTTARTLLLAQPPGTTRAVWGELAFLLAERYRVVRFDHRVTVGRDLGSHVEDLLELAEALRLQGAVHLGLGNATTIATEADAAGPGRFELLVACGARSDDAPSGTGRARRVSLAGTPELISAAAVHRTIEGALGRRAA